MSRGPLTVEVKPHENVGGVPPAHHVLAPAPGTTWTSYLPHWDPQPEPVALDGASSDDFNFSSQARLLADEERSQDLSCLPSSSSSRIALQDPDQVVRTGFRNPWPSAHKPTIGEVWAGLEWGEDPDPAIGYAMEGLHLHTAENGFEGGAHKPYRDNDDDEGGDEEDGVGFDGNSIDSSSTAPLSKAQKHKQAAQELLRVQEPDFAFDASTTAKLKATWLGHAGVLVQLPSSQSGGEPLRILFDPIFSQRCSPTQMAGPIRSYPAPCPVSALPPIDVVIISHNHYDHLDYETVKSLWEANGDRLRFVVPLGNKAWFVNGASPTPQGDAAASGGGGGGVLPTPTTASGLGIPEDRVTELDWWDQAILSTPVSAEGTSQPQLEITCTPAQHGSGRLGVDANCALWSSWFVEHLNGDASTKLFFGGDTGCQFHGADFPPSPPPPHTRNGAPYYSDAPNSAASVSYRSGSQQNEEPYPPCPAFKEIVSRLGTPDFLMLPVSVGATISFLRSYVPLPASYSPFPRIREGLTAANHMPPWDAVKVFNDMTRTSSSTPLPPDTTAKGASGAQEPNASAKGAKEEAGAVCMAIHWGTFISGPEEVLKTLGQLQWACHEQGVRFARSLPNDATSRGGKNTFIALDHGASITL